MRVLKVQRRGTSTMFDTTLSESADKFKQGYEIHYANAEVWVT